MNNKVVSGMLTTRYFYRWLFPVIVGVVVGYTLGFLGQTLLPRPCIYKQSAGSIHHRRILKKHAAQNKTIEIYKWPEDYAENRYVQKSRTSSGFLYVAMMSAGKYLDNRALAAVQTWAEAVRVKNPSAKIKRKSFSMMRYLAEHHLEEYDWFMRLDDDAYISWPILEKLLRRLDPSDKLYIGSPGFGKDDGDYVEEEMTYCMGGPGIVMSRELLRNLSPHLPSCLKRLYTEHEDLELGRCIQERLQISCIKAYEANRLFKQNYGYNKQTEEERLRYFSDLAAGSIATYHPNKEPQYQFEIHRAFKIASISDLIAKTTQVEMERALMTDLLNEKEQSQSAVGIPNGLNRTDIWDQFSSGKFFSFRTSTHKLQPYWVDVISSAARESAKSIYKRLGLGGKITRIQVPEMYHRLTETSSELVGTIIVRHNHLENGKQIQQTVSNSVRVRRSFLNRPFYYEPVLLSKSRIQKCITQNEKEKNPALCKNVIDEITVNIIVPLTGRSDALHRFMKTYSSLVKHHHELLNLIIVDFPASNAEFEALKDELKNYQEKISNTEIKLLREHGEFSRGKGLQTGAQACEHDDLLFFCDIDMVFNTETLRHIRQFTVQGEVAFYPTVFSKYDPASTLKKGNFHISEREGFWREYGFGMVSLYQADFLESGGFDQSLHGWGLEDVHLVTNFVAKGKDIMRANAASLVHPWHPKFCAEDLSQTQRDSCFRTRASHIASQPILYQKWLKKKN
ncbi:Oidioi.mRNA.OKI2018_I69.chr2.g6506.t1.cds [Oikopleura dioica]|uniref:Hexosyltransferase n=1 Tax=Oikopleura dioica TaxID=34765 RepID=A0ABN7T3P5_OIKDI|nr:Oidioi.mRNA.OKI2018_I69.chr2.g6506.t1.cds [Oikopleura dioica]